MELVIEGLLPPSTERHVSAVYPVTISGSKVGHVVVPPGVVVRLHDVLVQLLDLSISIDLLEMSYPDEENDKY